MVRVSFRWQRTVHLNRNEINLNIVKTDRLSNNVLEFESRNSKYYWRSLSPKRFSLCWSDDIECYEALVEIKEGRYHGALEFDDALHLLLPFRVVGLTYIINLTSASVKQFVQMSESICRFPQGYRSYGSAQFCCEDKSEDSHGQFRLYSSERSQLDRLATKDPISHPSVNLIYLLHNTAEKLRNELNDKKDEIRLLKCELSHEKKLIQQLLIEKREYLDIINNLFKETTLVKVPDEHLVSEVQSSSVGKRTSNHAHALQNRYSLEEVHYKDTRNNKVMSGEETTIDEIHLVLEDDKSHTGRMKDTTCDREDLSEGISKRLDMSSSQESFESASCSKAFDCDGSCSMSVEKETKGIQTVISTMPKKAHLLSSKSDYDFTYNTLPASFAKKICILCQMEFQKV